MYSKLKYQWNCFHNQGNKQYKTYLELEETKATKAILDNKNKTEDITILYVMLHNKAMVIKTASDWQKARHIDKWNKIEAEVSTRHVKSSDFMQKSVHLRKDSLFNKWY